MGERISDLLPVPLNYFFFFVCLLFQCVFVLDQSLCLPFLSSEVPSHSDLAQMLVCS